MVVGRAAVNVFIWQTCVYFLMWTSFSISMGIFMHLLFLTSCVLSILLTCFSFWFGFVVVVVVVVVVAIRF